MKSKLLQFLTSVFLASLFFTFTGCELIQGLLDPNSQKTQIELTIEKSGLAVNKYIRSSIDDNECDITLYAKNSTFSATKTARAAETGSYEGYFVYNSSTKNVFLCITTNTPKYKKINVDLSGTKGSNPANPISVQLLNSTKTEFNNSMEEVQSLPVETTADSSGTGDNGGTGDSGGTEEGGNSGDTGDSGGTGDSGNTGTGGDNSGSTETLPAAPYGKTYSDYVDGIRYINFGEKGSQEDVIFEPKIKPLPKPDFSAIDNAVKTLEIDSSKYSIEEAAKLIVKTAGAKTIKEKARAIYTWICYHVDYDYSYNRYEAENAYYDRSAVCDGYSKLVAKMCEAVDVEAPQWVGLVTDYGPQGKRINNSQHAWNRVCIDKNTQQYFVLDATWGSKGKVADHNKIMDDQWFDPDPCLFVTSHWSDEGGALISPTINRDDFMKLPILDPRLGQFFDGKELLEFCYAHDITKIVYTSYIEGLEYYKIPIEDSLVRGKEYEVAFDYNGSYVDKKFTAPAESTQETYVFCEGLVTLTYKLVDTIKDAKLGETEIADAKFIYYDDQVEYIPPEGRIVVHDIGNWKVGVPVWPEEKNQVIIFNSPDVVMAPWASSAEFDPLFQEWNFIKGHYRSSYNDYRALSSDYLSLKDFDDDPAAMIKQVMTKIDPRIDLSRTGDYRDRDYNEVYIPLSRKEEAENAVLNYDWTQDKEFADFVRWMQAHNVPQKQIDFYIKMAKFPYQRGKTLSIKEGGQKLCGPDFVYDSTSKIVDEQGNALLSGGMQKFFEFRKLEERHLFNNKTIPILMVHIKDADKIVTEEPPANFFEHEAENIKSKLSGAGLKNKFEVYFAEIEMSYSDVSSKLTTSDYMDIASWRQYAYLWDEAIAKVAEKDSELAKKFEDKTKSAIIKYFDNADLNDKIGNINGEYHVRSRLDNIMENIGYSRISHVNIFGSEMKYHSPQCFDMNCVRDVAICPLCMYSYDID